MRNPKIMVAGLLLLAGLGFTASAQVNFTTSYTQNFDGLANSPNGTQITLTNGLLPLAGWYYNTNVYSHYRISDGSSSLTDILSYGSISATDRALGVKHNGGVDEVAFGLRLINSSGSTISSLTVSFTGEQWHMENHDPATDPLHFEYKVGAGGLLEAGYITNATLTYFGTQQGSGALDGNQPANQTAKSGILSDLNWTSGQELWIRWSVDPTGPSQGLAVDNLVIAVPEPSTIALAGVAGVVLMAAMRRRRQVGV